MDISGQVALVGGGASGLGEATVRRLVEAGAKVVIADRNVARGEELAAELGDSVRFVRTDVTDADTVQAAVDVASELGHLRINVNCAGVGWAQRTVGRGGKAHDLGAFEMVVKVNLIGSFNVMRLCAARMSGLEPLDTGERGVVINTASVAAFDGQIGQVAYAASKGGIVGMTLPAARDLTKAAIRVCCIAPGLFDTPLLSALPDQVRDVLGQSVPFPPRLGNPSEYAALVASIIENSYLNGETIRIDGALRMPPK